MKKVGQVSGKKVNNYSGDGRGNTGEVDEILISVGRVPNVEDLNFETAGVDYNKKGVIINEFLQNRGLRPIPS